MRPSDDCSRYEPPAWGPAWGDPHLITMDGNEYTFNGRGEFVLLRIGDDVTDGEFHLQGRTDLVVGADEDADTNATVFKAFAAQATGESFSDILEVQLNVDATDVQIYVSNEDAGLLSGITDTVEFTGLQLERTETGALLAAFDNSISIEVSLDNGFLKVTLSAPPSYQSMEGTGGLFGNFDGDEETDFFFRNGDAIRPEGEDFTEEELFAFGQDWTLMEEESLFNYSLSGATNHTDFYFPDFVPTFYSDMLDNLTIIPGLNETAAEEICMNNRACLVDYVATRKDAVAMATKMQQEEFEEDYMMMKNLPPQFAEDTPDSLQVTVGEEFTLTLTAAGHDGKVVTMEIDTAIDSAEYTFDTTTNTFTWTPSSSYNDSTKTSYVKFIAQDQDGAKTVHWPMIWSCACSENADCSFAYLEETEHDSNMDRYSMGKCECHPGYAGDLCDDMKDECDPNPCFSGVECTAQEVPPGYECGNCPEFTVGDGMRCTAPNECLDGTATCDHICVNHLDGYKCQCQPGYQLEDDDHACEDIDECTVGTHNCSGEGMYCLNNDGGFSCQCKARYIYVADQDECVKAPKKFMGQLTFNMIKLEDDRIIEWNDDLSDENSAMYMDVASGVAKEVGEIYNEDPTHLFIGAEIKSLTEGSIVSQYYLSYEESSPVDGAAVGDILEAKLAHCIPGGPDCVVGNLYGINPALSFANVTDLCADTMTNDCDPQSTDCASTLDGTFSCECKDGYRKYLDIDNMCQDIDECEEDPEICDVETSECVNLPGSHDCKCKFGYQPDPDEEGICKDVCDPNPCKHDGTCEREEYNFICKCDGIYTGPTCDEEHDEAVKMRNIAIGVGAAVGALCLILLILLIIACVRGSDKYATSGEVSLDMWEPNSRSHLRSSDKYEMTENNGTKHGATQGSGDARPQQDQPGNLNVGYVHA